MFNYFSNRRIIVKKEEYRVIQLLRELEDQSFTGLCEVITEARDIIFEARLFYLWGYIVVIYLFFKDIHLSGIEAVEFIKRNRLFFLKGVIWADLLKLEENELVMDYLIDEDNGLEVPLKTLSFLD